VKSYKTAIGSRIKKRRIELGFKTQQAFADALGVDQPRVNKWENGANLPDAKHQALICKVLKIDREDLLSANGPTSSQDRAELILEIVLLISKMNAKHLKSLLEFAKNSK